MKTLLWIVGVLAIILIIWGIVHYSNGNNPTTYSTGTNATSTQTQAENCVVGDCPVDIYQSDNGKTFTYTTTSRFGVHLDNGNNPIGNLKCTPDGIVGRVANTPNVTSGAYDVNFEAVHEGTCILTDDNFQATIRVYQVPNAS